jgi:hypothetical protein
MDTLSDWITCEAGASRHGSHIARHGGYIEHLATDRGITPNHSRLSLQPQKPASEVAVCLPSSTFRPPRLCMTEQSRGTSAISRYIGTLAGPWPDFICYDAADP